MRDNDIAAFPLAGTTTDTTWPQSGMSLRDYFAGQALAGLMAASMLSFDNAAADAKLMYAVADAMLAARK